MVAVKSGDFIEVSYVGRIKGGDVFDLTDEKLAREKGLFNENVLYGPMPVVLGAGHMLPGLEKSVVGMEAGSKKKVVLGPEDAFGPHFKERVQLVPEKIFKHRNVDPKAGMAVNIEGMIGRVQSVSAGRVLVDFNHPLAGKDIEYDVTVEKLVVEPAEKVTGLLKLYTRRAYTKFKVEAAKDETIIFPETNAVDVAPEAMRKVAEDAKKYCGMKTVKFVFSF